MVAKLYNCTCCYIFGMCALAFHSRVCSFTMIILLVFLSFFSLSETVEAQEVTFSPKDVFNIPAVNGSIRFSVNGSYTGAVLENDTWIFSGLSLRNSRTGTLKFSAKNCNVIIHSFTPRIIDSSGNVSIRSSSIRYTVDGIGEQIVNIGNDPSKPSHPSEWSVINHDGVFFAEGKTWKLLPDDTMIINGISGNITVVRYSFGDITDNRSFYLRHSISISTAIILAVTVILTTIIKQKNTNKRLLP